MEKWEYLSVKVWWNLQANQYEATVSEKIIGKAASIHEAVNPLGAEGWELVNVYPGYLNKSQWTEDKYHVIMAVSAWVVEVHLAVFKRRLP